MSKYGRPQNKRQLTSCFVHTLLEQQGEDSKWAPSNEAAVKSRPADKASETPTPNHESQTQSRLLTKKQLSDMAFGIRELAQKLGHIRLILKVKTVFLLTKAHDENLIGYTRKMADWLLNNQNPDGDPYTMQVSIYSSKLCAATN